MRTLKTEITIAAPPAAVWAVITDLSRYHEWNPQIPKARGELKANARFWMTVRQPSGRLTPIRARVIDYLPYQRLSWKGGLPGLLKGVHTFELQATKAGTLLINREEFYGLFSWTVGEKMMRILRPHYDASNVALRDRVLQLENSTSAGKI